MPFDTSFGPLARVFEQGEHLWVARLEEPCCEIVVAGDDDEPDAERVAWAERAVPRLEALVPVATEYLERFIVYRGAWSLQAAEFGRCSPCAPPHEFEMLLTLEKDDYGLWAVRFRHHTRGDRFLPFQLSRRQW